MIQFIAQKGLLQESVEKVLYTVCLRKHKIHYSPLPEVPGEVLQIWGGKHWYKSFWI